MEIIKRAFAKINLGLEVLNKRPDDYHNINTIFYKINLSDKITFEKINSNEIILNSNTNIDEKDNLIYKTAKKVMRKGKVDSGVKITLEKNIPIGAGLGGGSSDAAETIKALDELWDLNFNENDKFILAQSIGSDVPFFLGDKPAVGTSRGERLSFFDFELPYNIVVAFPDIHISTADAYGKLDRSYEARKMIDFKKILLKSEENPTLLKDMLKNDFEKPIFEMHPIIKEIKSKFYELGAIFSLMSGSGSSVYALFDKEISTAELEKSLRSISSSITLFKA